MPINHDEIIEDIEAHIRKFGGELTEWCVGTAKDSRGPFFRRHLAADLGDGLIYREAFTTSAADQVIDHLVNACGLRPDHDSVAEPGKIVFVYHQTRDSRLGTRDTGLGVGHSGLGVGEKVPGIRCQVSGAESGIGIQNSGEVRAVQGTPQSAQPVFGKLAA